MSAQLLGTRIATEISWSHLSGNGNHNQIENEIKPLNKQDYSGGNPHESS